VSVGWWGLAGCVGGKVERLLDAKVAGHFAGALPVRGLAALPAWSGHGLHFTTACHDRLYQGMAEATQKLNVYVVYTEPNLPSS
jgi:hypothetical protein